MTRSRRRIWPGACNAVLNNLPEAAKYNVEFAELRAEAIRGRRGWWNPGARADWRAVRKIAGMAARFPLRSGRSFDAGALASFGGYVRRFRRQEICAVLRVLFEDAGKLAGGRPPFMTKLPADDRNYLDARYRLVVISRRRSGFRSCRRMAALGRSRYRPPPMMCLRRVRTLLHCSIIRRPPRPRMCSTGRKRIAMTSGSSRRRRR